jgi:molecular chaperone GrpE (heat shock protein)
VEDAGGPNAVATAPEQADTEPDQPEPVAELAAAVTKLADQVESHHVRAQARERIIDQLHAEVERLRLGQDSLVLRPVITDLQSLRDDLLRQAQTLPPDVDRDQVRDLLRSFALSTELALERCGSVPVRPEPGAVFSPREHRAVKVIDASQAEQDGMVAEIVSDGYMDSHTGKQIAPAKVHVWRWQSPDDTNDTEPEESSDG